MIKDLGLNLANAQDAAFFSMSSRRKVFDAKARHPDIVLGCDERKSDVEQGKIDE